MDRNGGLLYHDAIKINSSAHATFEFRAPDARNAILKFTTTSARLRVSYVVGPHKHGTADHIWLLLDKYNQKIGRGDTCYPETYHLHRTYHDSDREHFGGFCSMCLHSKTLDELTKVSAEEVGFVLLQHWSSIASRHAPGKIAIRGPKQVFPKENPQLEDTIWPMAIRRMSSGLGERLSLVSIPAKAWFAAEPQPVVVHIA